MSNASRNKIELDCNRIRALLEDGKHRSHKSIYTELNISRSVYHNRLKKIYAEDMNKITVIPERNTSQNPLQRMDDALELVSKTSYDIMTNSRNRSKDRLYASETFLDVEVLIYQQKKFGGIDGCNHDKKHSFTLPDLDKFDKDKRL